ncbi:MAG TPA: HAD family phosphatase [Anaerolineae bacterium]
MIEAIVFDLDGLLVDSEPHWNEARRQIAAERGIEWNRDDLQVCMGVSTLTWAKYMIRRLNLDQSPDQVISRMIGAMQALYARQIPYLPGAIEAVDCAARLGPTGLASGSHRSLIDIVIADAPLRGKFQAVVCADEVPAGKPAPDVYLQAARELGVQAENCVCLEDSANGILAGKSAGMQVIAVPDHRLPPSQEILRQADVVLASLNEFNIEVIHSLETRLR